MSKQLVAAASKTASVMLLLGVAVALVMGFAAVGPQKAYAAAKKQTVYVITKATEKSADYGNMVFSFTYQKNGLVKSIKNDSANSTLYDEVGTEKFAYSKSNKLKTVTTVNASGTVCFKYALTRDKKGRAVKGKYISGYYSMDGYKDDLYKYNKKGQLIKYKYKLLYGDDWSVATYDKKGRIATLGDGCFKFAYDTKGNIKSVTTTADGRKLVTCKNTYKGSKLTKKVSTFKYSSGGVYKYTCTYKYKKMKVPASVAAKVKAQQQTILFGEQQLSMNHFGLDVGRPFMMSVS